MRIWGLSNEKIKRCWINYTNSVETLSGLYFASQFFIEFVERYVDKKTEHYFSLYKDGQEWTAARRQAKKEQHIVQQQRLQQALYGNKLDQDPYQIKKNQSTAVGREQRAREREKEKQKDIERAIQLKIKRAEERKKRLENPESYVPRGRGRPPKKRVEEDQQKE